MSRGRSIGLKTRIGQFRPARPRHRRKLSPSRPDWVMSHVGRIGRLRPDPARHLRQLFRCWSVVPGSSRAWPLRPSLARLGQTKPEFDDRFAGAGPLSAAALSAPRPCKQSTVAGPTGLVAGLVSRHLGAGREARHLGACRRSPGTQLRLRRTPTSKAPRPRLDLPVGTFGGFFLA